MAKKSPEELQKLFLKFHFEWEAVNNPEGFASGKRAKAWEKRMNVLMALVRAERGED